MNTRPISLRALFGVAGIASLSCCIAIILAGTRTVAQSQRSQDSFELASIKPTDPAGPDSAARYGGGCDGGFPRVEQNRFTVTTTFYALMTWAYGFNKNGGCSFVSYGEFISGGPGWVKSDRFQLQALMPEGSPTYTTAQFLNGQAPKLEMMIQSLLADRFKLAVHREMKEAQGYALVAAKGGPKMTPAKEGARFSVGIRTQRKPDGTMSQHLVGTTPMTYVALTLVLVTHKPVVDRTGLTGDFTLDLEFAPQDATLADSSAPSIFTAIQEQLGLKLEAAKVPVEVLVIDHVEKPSEN